jgi:2-furoate---CoA ligase
MFDLGRGLLASAERMPGAIAISDGPIRQTYSEWRETVLRVAGGLNAIGLVTGDHVVTLLSNRYEAATLHLACQMVGLTITPLNWRARVDELDYVLADCQARALVFEPLTAAAVTASERAMAVRRIGLDDAPGASLTWQTLAMAEPATSVSCATPETISVMLYTSGTTGQGKGVPRTHQAERASAMAHVAQNLYQRGEITLGVMPLYHTMGVRSLLASVIINGHFICQRRFEPVEALRLIEAEQVSNLYLVPTLYHDLLAAPGFAVSDTSSVRKLGFAGQAMTDGLLKRLEAAFQPDLFVNHYGSSEGDLFVTGRVDDMIISGGENILPAEIESVLSLHPAVGEVAVVGLLHERWGQQVTAFITRRQTVDHAALDAWCLESDLAPYKRPRAYVFVTEIPKSPVGKMLRRLLVAGEYKSE